jgi:hypothetical protein
MVQTRKAYPVMREEKYHMPRAPKKMGTVPNHREPVEKNPSEAKRRSECD